MRDSSAATTTLEIEDLKFQLDRFGIINSTLTDATSTSATSTDELIDSHPGFVALIQRILAKLGLAIQDGVVSLKNLVVETFTAKTARIEQLEMVDKATGKTYCTWIENGAWQKTEGACGSASGLSATTANPSQSGFSSGSSSQSLPGDSAAIAGATSTDSGVATTTQSFSSPQPNQNAAVSATSSMDVPSLLSQMASEYPAEDNVATTTLAEPAEVSPAP